MTQTQGSACPFEMPPLADFLKLPPSGKPERAMIGLFNTAFGIGCSMASMVGLLDHIGDNPDLVLLENIPHFGKLVIQREASATLQPVYSFGWPDKPTVYVGFERHDGRLSLVKWSLEH